MHVQSNGGQLGGWVAGWLAGRPAENPPHPRWLAQLQCNFHSRKFSEVLAYIF